MLRDLIWGVFGVVCFGGVATVNCRAEHLAVTPRFNRLVADIVHADLPRRKQFATIALSVLTQSMRTEFTRVAPDGAAASGRWQTNALNFTAHLEHIATRIEAADEVAIIPDPQGVVRLAIDAEQVMLNAPRLSQQSRFEATIADLMCEEIDCADAAPAAADAGLEAPREVRTEWAFSDRGPPLLSASDGLHCMFSDTRHLRLKETVCAAVMQELRLLAESLRAVVEHGAVLDWSVLRVQRGAGAEPQIVYDRAGNFFELELPNLVSHEAIWRGAVPWLQAHLRGYSGDYLITDLDRLASITDSD